MRLFVAVEPPPELQAWLAEAEARLRRPADGLRWVDPGNAHLTLAFLGSQPEGRFAELKAAVEAATSGAAPFALRLGELGAFDSWRRARVLWVGLGGGAAALQGLVERLRRRLEAGGFPVEKREFVPHVTLARSREPRSLERLLEARSRLPPPPGRLVVDTVSIMRSFLNPDGARYEAQARLPLIGGVRL